MQDRFKFRYNNNNKIYDVSAIDFTRSRGEIVSLDKKETLMCKLDLNNLIQCTGLKDKNGKLIYEGDIAKLTGDGVDNIHVVKFGDFAMYDFDFQNDYEKGSTAVYGWYLGGQKYPIPLSISFETSGLELEVIGNIYENPELLKDGEYES